MPVTYIEIEEIEFLLSRDKFTIPALGSEQSKAWRKLVKDEAKDFVQFVQGQTSLLDSVDLGNIRELADTNVADVLPALMAVLEKVNDIYDAVPGLVAAYSDQISDKAVKAASMKQLTYALVQMIRIEFASPFQIVMNRSGPSDSSTSKNLPSPNGESAPENSLNSAN